MNHLRHLHSIKSKKDALLAQQSDLSIVLFSLASAFAVLGAALSLQWLIYDDWLHRTGPLRIVGSVLAGALTFVFAFRRRSAARERKMEMLQRFKTIAQMNDRIRNALQIIECATYATNPQATAPVRNAVDVIEGVLQEVLVETHPALFAGPDTGTATPEAMARRNSDWVCERRRAAAARSAAAARMDGLNPQPRNAPARGRDIRNQTDRFSLAIDAIDGISRFRETGLSVQEALLDMPIA